ncbi:MAG: flagellar hook-basal body protein [Alphaproteobacteria bacterium]
MFSIIRTGLDAANRDLAVISNNIANAGTNGFKKSEAQFEDLYHSQHNNSTETARGMGVKTIKPRQSFSQGSLQATNGSLDLAIMGEGFFTLGQPLGRLATATDRPSFTRDGSFQLDREGNLVNTDGLPLLGIGRNAINIPFLKALEGGETLLSEISVNSEGEILATYGLDNVEVVGQIELADFVNEHGLKNIGNARFQETQESGVPTFGLPKERTIGKIQAGFLEKSNTDITDEIVLMMRTQRAFNGCSKLLQSEIDVTKKLSQR